MKPSKQLRPSGNIVHWRRLRLMIVFKPHRTVRLDRRRGAHSLRVACYVSLEVLLTRRAAGNLPNGPDMLIWERVPPSPPLSPGLSPSSAQPPVWSQESLSCRSLIGSAEVVSGGDLTGVVAPDSSRTVSRARPVAAADVAVSRAARRRSGADRLPARASDPVSQARRSMHAYFRDRRRPSMKTSSIQRPRPSAENPCAGAPSGRPGSAADPSTVADVRRSDADAERRWGRAGAPGQGL